MFLIMISFLFLSVFIKNFPFCWHFLCFLLKNHFSFAWDFFFICYIGELTLHNNSRLFPLFITKAFQFRNIWFRFQKSSCAISMHHRISVSHIPSSVKTLSKYVNFCTCLTFPIRITQHGLLLLLTTMHYVFL